MSIIEITLKEQEEGRRMESFNILASTSSALQTAISDTSEVSSYTHTRRKICLSVELSVSKRGGVLLAFHFFHCLNCSSPLLEEAALIVLLSG